MKNTLIEIKNNLAAINNKIEKQAQKFNRDLSEITLIAVSKVQPEERIEAMLKCGHRVYGENRVQEAQERWGQKKVKCPDIKLHLIGSLQTNKVKEAVALFDVIETLDRPKLATALAQEMKKQDKHLPCFIQVNTGEEPQKSGVLSNELPDFLSFCKNEGLNVIGLMCIPPSDEPPALHFAFLKKLAEDNGLEQLSMGMSGDFEKAIALGATHIRVGSALFGARSTTH